MLKEFIFLLFHGCEAFKISVQALSIKYAKEKVRKYVLPYLLDNGLHLIDVKELYHE